MSAELIERFYRAFAARDAATMAACYAPTARFDDPVFPGLVGPEIGGMWGMLCERARDLRVEWSAVRSDGTTGSAHWEAWYTYTATGRPVHNRIDASFTFVDGLVVRHTDRFDLYRWTRQALGLKGTLLGWTPLVQGAVRRQARRALGKRLGQGAAE